MSQVSNDMSREDLLAYAKARQRAAGNKVSRLKNSGVVNIGGTSHDPRRDSKKVSRYTKNQLISYANKLDTFTARSTKFMGDAHGLVIDPAKFALYKERERAYKHLVEKDYNKIKDVKLPYPGTSKASKKTSTIDQRNKQILPDNRAAGNRTVNSKYKPPSRKSTHFKSAAALDRMIEAMGKRLAGDYKSIELRDQRRILNDMLAIVNNKDLIGKANKLSDKQFDIMWNHTSMPDDVKIPYLIMQKNIDSSIESHKDVQLKSIEQEQIESNSKMVGKWIGWASSLKLNG